MSKAIHLLDNVLANKGYNVYDEQTSYCGHYLDDFSDKYIPNTADPDFATCKTCLSLYNKQLKTITDKKIKQKMIKKR